MANAFIFSAANSAAQKHFQDTVVDGIPLDLVLAHIGQRETAETLKRAYPDGKAYLWAGRSGKHDERYWDQMVHGDLLLGYRDRSIISAAFIVGKVKSESLAIRAWPDAAERPYDLIYFMDKPDFVSRPVADLPRYFATMYQGLRRLPTSPQILTDFGDFRAFVRQALAKTDYPQLDDIKISEAAVAENVSYFDATERPDARDRVLQTIVRRRGQDSFRLELLTAYDGQCAISGCTAVPVLEAAHIIPYNGKQTNHVQNGLLLRADLHTLFDLGLIGVEARTVRVSRGLCNSEYAALNGQQLRAPRNPQSAPSPAALARHFATAALKNPFAVSGQFDFESAAIGSADGSSTSTLRS